MSENLVVRTTVDFILGSAKNLDLALQVEEAMPQVRADLIGEFLNSVEAELSTDGWRVHKPGSDILKAKARLELCDLDWPTESDPNRTSIRLGTSTAVWTQVFVGVYLSEMTRNRIRENEQKTMEALKQASAKLPSGRGWRPHDFSNALGDWNGWATYRNFDVPLRDWGSDQFLRNSIDADRKREMIQHVVDEINMLKPGACALVQAAMST